jgi:hypothetical protein
MFEVTRGLGTSPGASSTRPSGSCLGMSWCPVPRRIVPWPTTSRGLNDGSVATFLIQAPPTVLSGNWPSCHAEPVTTPMRSPANASKQPSCYWHVGMHSVFARQSSLPSVTGATCWWLPGWLMRTGQLSSTVNLGLPIRPGHATFRRAPLIAPSVSTALSPMVLDPAGRAAACLCSTGRSMSQHVSPRTSR